MKKAMDERDNDNGILRQVDHARAEGILTFQSMAMMKALLDIGFYSVAMMASKVIWYECYRPTRRLTGAVKEVS